jgi:hypothetical protein
VTHGRDIRYILATNSGKTNIDPEIFLGKDTPSILRIELEEGAWQIQETVDLTNF